MATAQSNSSPPEILGGNYRKRSKSSHTLMRINASRTLRESIEAKDTSDNETELKTESRNNPYSQSNYSLQNRPTRLRSRAHSTTDLLSHIIDDSDSANEDDIIQKRMIISLQLKTSHLESILSGIRLQYNDIDSKYKICIKENEILKEYMIKYDNKSNEYDTLLQNYDEVKINLINSKTKQQLYFDHNKELTIQKDELLERYELIEQENIDYKHEINSLQQMRESLNIELITLQNDINKLQKELTTIQSINSNENIAKINNFKHEISLLKKENQQLQIKLKLRNDLGRFKYESDRDRDSFDENEFESEEKTSSQSNSQNIINYDENEQKLSRSNSRSSSPNICIDHPWHSRKQTDIHFNCEDLEFINMNGHMHNESDSINMNEQNVIPEIGDSLWHDIDIQIIKIEALLIENNRFALGDIEIQKTIEYNINHDVNKLPKRLECIYNELEHKECDMKDDVRQRYESMISLNEIKIKNLQNKIKEIKNKNDVLQYNLNNVKKLYEGYKIQTKDYLYQYK
eukprot:526415_1